MKYIRLTFQYIRKHFLKLLAYVSVPAVLLALVSRPESVFRFFMFMEQSEYATVLGIMKAVMGMPGWLIFVGFILAYLIMLVFISALTGTMETNMRYGQVMPMSGKYFWKKVNSNALSMLKGGILFIISVVTFAVLLSLLIFFWIKVLPGAALLMSIISTLVVLVGAAVYFTYLTLLLPNMTQKGVGLFHAYGMSVSTVSRRFGGLFVAVALPLVAAFIPVALGGLFLNIWWAKLIGLVFYAFVLMYYFTLMYVAYFDIEDIEREDIKNETY